MSFDSASRFVIAITSRQSNLFLLQFSMATESYRVGKIVDRNQVLTLLAIENVYSAIELEAGFTAKILHIVQIFTLSFLSALSINLTSLIIS